MAGRMGHGVKQHQGGPAGSNTNRPPEGDGAALARGWDAPQGALFVTVRARLTAHFVRRLEERGGNLERLVVEDDTIVAEGWLRAVHDHDFNLVVPGFGQIRIRVDRYGGGGFVAVTFLPFEAS